MTLAKSHWHPHSPLMNSGVTGPTTEQDCTGAQKISALMVPTASGTVKNTSTPTHWAVTQLTRTATKAGASEKNALRRPIHKALVKFFSCLPCTPLHSPTAPTAGQRTVVWCSTPFNALRLPVTTTVTSTLGQSASMAGNASSSPRIFPTFTPVNAALLRPSRILTPVTGHFPQPWKTSKTMPSRWNRPLWPSSVMVWLPAKQEGDVTAWLAHMPENHGRHACGPNDGVRWTSGVSQGGLREGKRTAGLEGWGCLTPRTGRMV